MSVYPAPGRVAFMPGNGAGEIPGPLPEIASDLPGPGEQKGRDPGQTGAGTPVGRWAMDYLSNEYTQVVQGMA